MAARPTQNPRPDYGIDAPGLVRTFFMLSAAAAATAGLTIAVGLPSPPWGLVFASLALVAAGYTASMGVLMTYWSRVVKVRNRNRFLDAIDWRGDETVLDVGCGRGLMLVGAASRVPAGGAVGVDIWQQADQGDNRPEAALENARRDGVQDRVSVETADMRSLPCSAGSFDAVVSHLAVHNLPDPADRERAIREMVRVLKPGGWLLVADLGHHAEYARLLTEGGFTDLRRFTPNRLEMVMTVLSGKAFYPCAILGRKPQSHG